MYKIFTGKPLGKQLLGKVKRLENTGNIKMEFREMGCEDIHWEDWLRTGPSVAPSSSIGRPFGGYARAQLFHFVCSLHQHQRVKVTSPLALSALRVCQNKFIVHKTGQILLLVCGVKQTPTYTSWSGTLYIKYGFSMLQYLFSCLFKWN